jgi:hypothetical protein
MRNKLRIKLNGQYIPRELTEFLRGLKGDFEIEAVKVNGKRTNQQSKSIHLFCAQLADELTEKHIDKRSFFKESFYTNWTPISVKEDIWRPVQKALFHKDSTTKLNKQNEIDLIWETINKILIEKYKGNVTTPDFPNEARLQDELFNKYKNEIK